MNEKVKVKSLSRVRFFATLRTAAYQAPPSMGFPGKSAAVDCHFLLQGIFPTQELNPALLHCRQILYQLSYKGRVLLEAINVIVYHFKYLCQFWVCFH